MKYVHIGLLVTALGCPTGTETKESDSHSGMTMTTPTGTATGTATGTTTDCYSCATFLTATVTPTYTTTTYLGMCPDSAALYNDLSNCVCGGACMEVCGDNACAGKAQTAECTACAADVELGCGTALNACLGDL